MKKLTYLSLIGVSLLVFSFIVFRSDLAEEIVLLDILTIEEVDPVVEEPIFEEESSGLLSTDPISDPIEEPKQEVEEAVDSGHWSDEEDADDNEEANTEEVFVSEESWIVSVYSSPEYIIEIFTGSTIWTVPLGVTEVEVFAVGGGWGGAGDGPRADTHGNGGKGGEVVFSTGSVIPWDNIAITVGAGGIGGGSYRCSYDSGGPTTGGNTSFGAIVTANWGERAHLWNTITYCSNENNRTELEAAGRSGDEGTFCPFCNMNEKYGAGWGNGCTSYRGTCSGGAGGDTGGGTGGGGANNATTNKGGNAVFYGGGWGGGAFSSSHTYSQGGNGYQGIVIIRYQVGGFSVSYSTKELTTGSVIVTVTAVESGSFSFESGGRYTLDEGLSYSKTYIDNITGELVSFVNSGGDTFVRPIIITWIVPEVFLIYTPEWPVLTTGSVNATVGFNKPWITITNNAGSDTYTFTEIGSFPFEWKDAYGNTGLIVASVDWIGDGISIQPTITYTPPESDGPTEGSVTATISFNKSWVTITNNGGDSWYTFTENGDFTFTFKDIYGQTGSATAKVNWILEQDFDYTGGPTTFTVYTQGYYKLQVRGAEWGNGTKGGKGWYAEGTIPLDVGDTLLLYVGQQGSAGGRNGGGAAASTTYRGGGATDIRFWGTDLTDRIIVAGGGWGGGQDSCALWGAGGGTWGIGGTSQGSCGTQWGWGTQTEGGIGGLYSSTRWATGQFWVGATALDSSYDGWGGGWGRYGGGAGSSAGWSNGWGGGSAYIGTLINGKMIAGNQSMPNPEGGTQIVGKSWNGYAHITLLFGWKLTYSPNTWTNQDVRATLIFNQPVTLLNNHGWSSSDSIIWTKTYANNIIGEIVDFENLEGTLTGSTEVNIDRIDKIPPTVITEDRDTSAPENLVIVITLDKPSKVITPGRILKPSGIPEEAENEANGIGTIREKTYTENTTEEIKFLDVVGNEGSAVVEVTTFSSGNTWWGGSSLVKDTCPNGDKSPSYYDGTCEGDEEEGEHGVADEKKSIYETAYERAKEYGITTASTYEEARTTDVILRQEMAKMISTYAIKLFQKTPDTSKVVCSQFHDLSQAGGDLQPYIIQSCELGLMGMNGDGIGVQENFFPSKTITRAEVGTILSRLLRGTQHATQLGDETYYARHLQALKKAGIMNFISNPDMLELRGNILLMLWKSVVM